MTTLNQYQEQALRTDADIPMKAAIYGLGIAGESGEVADMIKKHLGHGHPLDLRKFKKELGDVLWYVAALAHEAGFTLEEVAEANIEKLWARYPDGFSSAASLARVDERNGLDIPGCPP